MRVAGAIGAVVLACTGCGGDDGEPLPTATSTECVARWNAGSPALDIPALAATPGPFANAEVSVRVRRAPRPCLISLANSLGGWYQIAFRADRELTAEAVREEQSGSFRTPFADFGPPNASLDASGRIVTR